MDRSRSNWKNSPPSKIRKSRLFSTEYGHRPGGPPGPPYSTATFMPPAPGYLNSPMTLQPVHHPPLYPYYPGPPAPPVVPPRPQYPRPPPPPPPSQAPVISNEYQNPPTSWPLTDQNRLSSGNVPPAAPAVGYSGVSSQNARLSNTLERRREDGRSDRTRKRSRSRSKSRKDHANSTKDQFKGSESVDRKSGSSGRLTPNEQHWKAGGKSEEVVLKRPSSSLEDSRKLRFLRCSDYYKEQQDGSVKATEKLGKLHELFRTRVLKELQKANKKRDEDEPQPESSDESDDGEIKCEKDRPARKRSALALHNDLPYNERNMLNDGKACYCSKVLREYGTKHGHFVGEEKQTFSCDIQSNNSEKLHFYQVLLSPSTNFATKDPTSVRFDGADFQFTGFCLASHVPLDQYPGASSSRFKNEYHVSLKKLPVPSSFVVEDLNLLKELIFYEILELRDWNAKAKQFENQPEICDPIHLLPLFTRSTGSVVEVAPCSALLDHIIRNFAPSFSDFDLTWLDVTMDSSFQEHVDRFRGSVVAFPGRRPAAIRVDQVDKETGRNPSRWPLFVHFTTKTTTELNANLKAAQDKLDKMTTDLQQKDRSQVSDEDRAKLVDQRALVEQMSQKGRSKKEVAVERSSRGSYFTGLRSDLMQHALLAPWILFHYRYQISLDILEQKLEYKFKDRNLLMVALTHPSCKTIYGTNPDHIRNSQNNLGFRKAMYGQQQSPPKSGVKSMISTMAQLGVKEETSSSIMHYERLEFLGDAVLEFIVSLRLFLIFPHIQEGGLATFRSTVVQNSQLVVLAETYHLGHYLLILHGREESSRKRITDRHATANCFEAICGAIYQDGGMRFVDEFLARTLAARLFANDEHLQKVWNFPPQHPSAAEYPKGDRELVNQYDLLRKLEPFEEMVGIRFKHIRLLANAFSARTMHENPITIGNNQRLEFLGDTVLQLLVSDYVYRHFPDHHEGHLSLLRSSLVSNKTQAYVCEELGMAKFLIRHQDSVRAEQAPDLKLKDKADLVEAFLGALYLDKGLTVCHHFCMVTFYPKLTDFIANQAWSDPKSRLQQCCLTMKTTEGAQLPVYKVINKIGPSNNRNYEVAVYWNKQRMGTGKGTNTKAAEEAAAENALKHPMLSQDIDQQKNFAKRAVAAQTGRNSVN